MPEWSRLRKRILKRIKPTQEEILETEIFLEELTTRL
jgi:hypothetical protein